MNKEKFVDKLTRWQKIFKTGLIVSIVVFGIIFAILFVSQVVASYTASMWVVWSLIIVTLFAYAFAGAYFVNGIIIKIYTKKKDKT